MKEFIGNDYLLTSPLAISLYEGHAKNMPVFDFHCHLSPKAIATDHRFKTITAAWLYEDGAGDHYKWRLLREMGVDEKYITGDASDYEKFLAFAKAMPYFIGNPIYEWAHMELKTFFGIDEPLCEDNAKRIYDKANEILKDLSCRKMLERCNVKELFTTDDPLDDLHYHEAMAKDESLRFTVKPCWRPDVLMKAENGGVFRTYLTRFEEIRGCEIPNISALFDAISARLDYFQDHGCVASDHDIADPRFSDDFDLAEVCFEKIRGGKPVSEAEVIAYRSALLSFLGKEYARHGWVMQLHIGALRNVSSRQFALLGKDSGLDSVNDIYPVDVAAFMNHLDKTDELPKTVLYALNEKDYGFLSGLVNDFSGGSKGKIQLGAAWWFNDHHDGILNQLSHLSSKALLSCFIGMLTDSRSFLSYVRHDYFRRILCSYVADFVNEGRYPDNMKVLGKIVEDICYNNASEYFLGSK